MILQIFAAAIPAVFSKLFFSGPITGGAGHHVCELRFQFPSGFSLNDFNDHKKHWLDISSFERTVQGFLAEGSMIRAEEKHIGSGLQVMYVFRDIQSHDRFVTTVNSSELVSVGKLSKIGFNFTRRHYIIPPVVNAISLT